MVTIGAATIDAGVPVWDMTRETLGVRYSFAVSGQLITRASVHSSAVNHAMELLYAPFTFVYITGGAGINRFSVNEYSGMRFKSGYSFSPSTGMIFTTPRLFNRTVAVSAGIRLNYMRNIQDGFQYTATVYNPKAGFLVIPLNFLYMEIGSKMHILDGKMREPDGEELSFSNEEIVRGYAGFTLYSPRTGAFFTATYEASKSLATDLSNCPFESAVRLSCGICIRAYSIFKKNDIKNSSYFPNVKELREKQREMKEELKE
jgi:hypothetical protein